MPTASDFPIRLLAIAPYEAMTAALLRAAEAFPGVRLEAYTGDLQEGVEIVRGLDISRFDAVLSRGGTADLIRAAVDLPVIEIPVSVYDVLRTIKLSENYTDRIAIVGFPGVTGNAHTLCNLLRKEIPIRTVHDSQGAERALDKLRSEGIHTVISDMVTHGIARSKGLNALLITSGEGSLSQALQEAAEQGASFRRIRNENLLLRGILGQDFRHCVVFNQNREQVFTFAGGLSEELLSTMRRRIPSVQEEGETLFYYHVGGALHAVRASVLDLQGQKYYLFRDQPGQIPLRSAHSGIRSYDAAECEQLTAGSFFSVNGSLGELEQKLTPLAVSDHPVMILGEEGTGREQVARSLYLRCRLKNHPFITVDGERLNDRGWDFLLSHHASPLSTSGTAILFRRMEAAPPSRQKELLSLIEETGLTRRLWLLFSCTYQDGVAASDFSKALSVQLGPLTLHLPTLRSRRDEIPGLASLYLGNLNMELNKQISGFEPDALEMMLRYDWPGNYTQFKHVLQELTILTSGPYISAADVAELLSQERRVHRLNAGPVPGVTTAGMTLEDITRAAIHQALAENGGNQSLTARQLGISRTTLWRILSQRVDAEKK